MSIQRLDAGNGLFSLGVSHNGTVTTAGIVADDLSQDAKGQAAQILKKIDEVLAHFGTSKAKLLTANLWVSDIRYRGLVNEAWTAWADKKALPTRATVEAKLAEPTMLVEIQVTAAAG
jgi:enamine deaminase RidA (YjgF/YER057c/UK114 family)